MRLVPASSDGFVPGVETSRVVVGRPVREERSERGRQNYSGLRLFRARWGRMGLTQDRYEHLLVDRLDDGIAVVTLNRPDRLNAVNKALHAELAAFSRDAQQDRSV